MGAAEGLLRRRALKMKRKRAFTLIELILVVTVIITLSLIAIPNFSKSKNRAMQKEALSNLKLIAAGERIYKMENNNSYVSCSCVSAANCANTSNGCNYLLKLMLNASNWQYSVSSAGATCTITAVSTSTSCRYSLNSVDFDTSDFSASSGCS